MDFLGGAGNQFVDTGSGDDATAIAEDGRVGAPPAAAATAAAAAAAAVQNGISSARGGGDGGGGGGEGQKKAKGSADDHEVAARGCFPVRH